MFKKSNVILWNERGMVMVIIIVEVWMSFTKVVMPLLSAQYLKLSHLFFLGKLPET